ncbi:leucine-rich repeat-containing protein 41 [Esox lucius]|uniref:Leucine-rich repeat-containing protein 41 n=1 Tax=Esox lucius TaxID=8010 RepID=A0A3P8X8E6_ESOLU|nr:leucine-rich repeat-containing protein 41 [Esox lucius]
MFVSYIEQIKRAHDRRMAKYTSTSTPTLKDICLKTVSHHVDVLEKKALDLPVSLIKELLPHLNIVDLDRIQPAVNLRGISTSFVWAGILREISGPRKGITRLTEVEWREKIMNKLFNMAFYSLRFRGDAKYLLNVNFNTLLLVMAKYIQHLLVFRTSPPCGFIERRPVLSVLETTVRSIQLEVNSRLREFPGDVLYALHRLLDHGAARSVVIAHSPDPCLLAWILHGRGPQSASNQCPLQSIHGEREPGGAAAETTAACLLLEDAEPEGTQPKRPRLSIASAEEKLDRASCPCQCMDPKPPCQMFVPSASPSKESCPKGQIHSLAINCFRDGILPVLLPLLPSWLCLRSLSLHSAWTFEEGDVLSLAECLRRLSEQGGCSLTELSVGSLPHPALMESLLNACPSLRSFSMEIHPVAEYQHAPLRSVRQHTHQTELSLEKLCVKAPNLRTSVENLQGVLKRSPHLTSLHVSGINCSASCSPSHLIQTLAESNRQLKELTLEDMNLSDCHCAIFQLLDHNCMLEVLSLKDCRLLEKCSKKEDAVRQLVNSIKKVSTLRSLNLVQNRLAKNVIVLGELFMGPSPSTLKELDISSNFIKPSELLEFGRLLETHHPPWRLLVTLKSNPLDREMALKDTALGTLSHVCDLITDHWNSKDTMADHVSIM